MKKLIIGSDKSGFILKEAIKKHLIEQGYDIEDCGTWRVEEAMPFFEVAPIAARKIQKGQYEKGILICGTGMGMAIVANKFKGVYAAVVENTYGAEKARAINNANILTLGGWITAEIAGCAIVDKFLNTAFTQDLEAWRQEFLKNAYAEVKMIEEKSYSNEGA